MVAIEHRVKSTPATTTATTTIDITNNSSSSSSSSSSNNNISSHIVQTSSTNNNNIHNNNNNNNINISNSDLEIINLPSANLTPVTPTSPTTASVVTTASTTTTNSVDKLESSAALKMSSKVADVAAESQEKQNEKPKLQTQRSVDIKVAAKSQDLTKKGFKLDLKKPQNSQDELSLKSPKSPVSARLPHQTSLNSSVDVEDRKTLREALYQGIFSRHRRTIFAFGSFLRMLRSRTSQYNTIRSSSEGEDVDEVR